MPQSRTPTKLGNLRGEATRKPPPPPRPTRRRREKTDIFAPNCSSATIRPAFQNDRPSARITPRPASPCGCDRRFERVPTQIPPPPLRACAERNFHEVQGRADMTQPHFIESCAGRKLTGTTATRQISQRRSPAHSSMRKIGAGRKPPQRAAIARRARERRPSAAAAADPRAAGTRQRRASSWRASTGRFRPASSFAAQCPRQAQPRIITASKASSQQAHR